MDEMAALTQHKMTIRCPESRVSTHLSRRHVHLQGKSTLPHRIQCFALSFNRLSEGWIQSRGVSIEPDRHAERAGSRHRPGPEEQQFWTGRSRSRPFRVGHSLVIPPAPCIAQRLGEPRHHANVCHAQSSVRYVCDSAGTPKMTVRAPDSPPEFVIYGASDRANREGLCLNHHLTRPASLHPLRRQASRDLVRRGNVEILLGSYNSRIHRPTGTEGGRSRRKASPSEVRSRTKMLSELHAAM